MEKLNKLNQPIEVMNVEYDSDNCKKYLLNLLEFKEKILKREDLQSRDYFSKE